MPNRICRYDRAELDALKADADLVAIVGEHVKLRRQGRDYVGLCPFHKETSPSFYVVPAKSMCHCFGCGRTWDPFQFLCEAENLSFHEAVAALGGRRSTNAESTIRSTSIRTQDDETRRREQAAALAIWDAAHAGGFTLVHTYLTSRAIRLPAPLSLRLHAALPYWHTANEPGARPKVIHSGPAMVAAITNADDRLIGAHRTWLAPNGAGKAEIVSPCGEVLPVRKVRGHMSGGAIRLGPPAPVLLIGEGIETTLSALQSLLEPQGPRWRSRPATAWAGVSLANIAGAALGRSAPHPDRPGAWVPASEPDPNRPGLMPPAWAEEIILLGDGDSDPHVTRASLTCAALRFAGVGVRVGVAWADPGKDFNDMLRDGDPIRLQPQLEASIASPLTVS